MGNRFYYGMPASQAFQAMNAMDDDTVARVSAAADSAGAAAGSAAGAASSATAAGVARDAAIAAWQASTVPIEQLAAISKQFHSGALVDIFLYDTSRDSDGGAWINRCAHTSWENEPLCTGAWRGQLANLAAAWNVAGAAAGDFYQNTADGKFYMIGGTKAAPTQAEVFRGNSRKFPALAIIIAEASRVVVYDATQAGCPMWMVFKLGGSSAADTFMLGAVGPLTSLAALNGKLFVGYTGALSIIDFVADSRVRLNSSDSARYNGGIVDRNAGKGHATISGVTIVNAAVNDIAVTVLPDAPIDPVSGMPIVTVAIATAGGISVIKQDGAVYSITGQGQPTMQVEFTEQGEILSHDVYTDTLSIYGIPSANVSYATRLRRYYTKATPTQDASYPKLTPGAGKRAAMNGAKLAFGSTGFAESGVALLQENPASPAKGMVAHITNAYNTGWQVGDSRGAWLADTVAETVAASGELVTNGTFDVDTAGWTAGGNTAGTTITWSSGTIGVTAPTGANVGWAAQQLNNLVVGRTYSVAVDLVSSSGANRYIRIGNVAGGSQIIEVSNASLVVGTNRFNFVATATSHYISVCTYNAQTCVFDNISVRLAEPDRSVKGKGLIVNGSLTKAPVAAGAQLVGYSGFSATNYLEQPYSADLDFGTGDFCVMGWIKVRTTSESHAIFQRTDKLGTSFGSKVLMLHVGGGKPRIYVADGARVSIATATDALSTDGVSWTQVIGLRRAGILELWVNGALAATATSTQDVSAPNMVSLIGMVSWNGQLADVPPGLSLIRVSATAPSADQIAQIYRDELALFRPNAQCTIDGTSTAVTAMAYDDSTDLLHVGTSWGRSAFRGLQRVESVATTVGSITSIAAGAGAHITAGVSGARYSQPAISLREELRRRFEARQAMAREETPFDFDGIATQTAFTLPLGFRAKGVFVAGVKKRTGATKDYTVSFDGYRETVNFGVSPGATWVQITANRSN